MFPFLKLKYQAEHLQAGCKVANPPGVPGPYSMTGRRGHYETTKGRDITILFGVVLSTHLQC